LKALKTKSNQGGFTLVELLITMIVLGIVITSLAGLYYVMQIQSIQNLRLDLAIRAARTEIEDLRTTGYSSLTPGQNIDFTSSLPSQLPPDKKGTVIVSEPDSGLRRVDVTVTYTSYGIPETVELSSDIGIIGITQGQ